jgi:tRNA G10  N-methylase Trm11
MKLHETLIMEVMKPHYDPVLKTAGGPVKEWLKKMGVEPEHIVDAMEEAKKLPSYKKLLDKFSNSSSEKLDKNGTFTFAGDTMKYSVYANGVIRQERNKERGSYNHYITKLAAPKPALVHGSPVKSLIKIYDNAFKALGSKKLSDDAK